MTIACSRTVRPHFDPFPTAQRSALRCRAVAHGDLQQPAAADQRQRLAGRDIGIRPPEPADRCAADRELCGGRHAASNSAGTFVVALPKWSMWMIAASRQRRRPARRRAGSDRRSAGEAFAASSPAASIAGDRGHDVAAVKRVARLAPAARSARDACPPPMPPPGPGDQAVVGADDDLPVDLARSEAAGRSRRRGRPRPGGPCPAGNAATARSSAIEPPEYPAAGRDG